MDQTKQFLTSSYLRAWLGKNITKAEIVPNHTRSVTSSPPPPTFECQNCDSKKKFVDLSSLFLHLSSHVSEAEQHCCHLCLFSTSQVTEFGQHMRDRHAQHGHEMCNLCDDQEIYASQCQQCQKSFRSHNLFLLHVKKHQVRYKFNIDDDDDNGVNDRLECVICHAKYLNELELWQHLEKYLAEKETVYSCSICGAKFGRKKGIRNHLLSVHVAGSFVCGSCGKLSKTKSIHLAHMRTHDTRRGYLCIFCGKNFAQAAGLSIHIRNLHREASYPCRYCERIFSKPAARYTHEYAHRFPDSVTCKICSRQFTQRSALNTHNKNSHPELLHEEQVKQYPCGTCGKVYHMKKYLLEHIVVHTKEKHFHCNCCGKLFGWKRSLRHHVQTVHGVARNSVAAIVQ